MIVIYHTNNNDAHNKYDDANNYNDDTNNQHNDDTTNGNDNDKTSITLIMIMILTIQLLANLRLLTRGRNAVTRQLP